MRRLLLLLFLLPLLAACDVPKPPPELPTPSPGSANPEVAVYATSVRATPVRGFTPIAAGPGQIYFLRGGHVWAINPDGSGERQISDAHASGGPQVSHDRASIAWIGVNDLYVMSIAGGEASKIYSGPLAEKQRIGWSTDDAMIGVVTYDLEQVGVEKAWAVPVAGGEPLLLTDLTGGASNMEATYERAIKWSPDNNWVIIGGSQNPLTLRRWPLSTTRSGDIQVIPGGEPDWSPDSRTLIYTESLYGAILVYGVLEAEATPFRNEEQLVGTGAGSYGQGPGPLWSPASIGSDSDLLIYRSRTISGEPVICLRTRGGRDLAPLPNLTNNAAWSPSGDKLVLETGHMQNSDLGPRWESAGLSIVEISLTGEHTITRLVENAQWPTWSE